MFCIDPTIYFKSRKFYCEHCGNEIFFDVLHFTVCEKCGYITKIFMPGLCPPFTVCEENKNSNSNKEDTK